MRSLAFPAPKDECSLDCGRTGEHSGPGSSERFHLTRQLPESERALAREALWSIAARAHDIDPFQLPPALRPLRFEEGLEIVTAMNDAEAPARRRTALWAMLSGPAASPTRAAGGDGDGRPSALRAMGLPIDLPAYLNILLSTTVLLRDLLTKIAMEWAARAPCGWPVGIEPARSIHRSITKQTEIHSLYGSTHTIEELRELLDPRSWARCGDLFRDTHRVTGDAGRPYARMDPDPDPLGESWRGYLYESTATGTTANDVILGTAYTVTRSVDRKTGASSPSKIEAAFHLVDAVSTSLGAFELTGLLQEDVGLLVAEPTSDPRFRSQLVCQKTIQVGRVSAWSGGAGWDFGEIFNYLAPAILTLWTIHLQSIVPCCQDSH